MSNVIINADLSQAELRVMALLSGDEWMIAALQEGQGDFFNNHMMPVCFPEKLAQYGSIENYMEQDPIGHKEDRTKVKGIQYGLAFGRQAFAIAVALGLTVAEAETILSNYLSTASNFAQWREDIMVAAINPAKRDMLINPFGRKFQSEVITTANFRNIQREALSFLPQSTSSDICLTTGIRIQDQLHKWGYDIINIVHDALMIEGPLEAADYTAQYVCKELRRTGEMVFGTTVPFLSDYSIGKSWADLS